MLIPIAFKCHSQAVRRISLDCFTSFAMTIFFLTATWYKENIASAYFAQKVSKYMYKIAVVDDDESWGLAVQRFFRNDFEVSIFTITSRFLQKVKYYDLVMVDFSIPPVSYEKDMDGRELINHLKQTLLNPPILVLATGFISKNDSEIGKKICPSADAFFTKDAGLAEILQQTQLLLASRKGEMRRWGYGESEEIRRKL